MSFKKSESKQEPQDDGARLLCSEFGCTNPWTVQIEKPKCSLHQWKKKEPPPEQVWVKLEEPMGDGRDWARIILAKQEMGYKVRKISLEFAKEALKLKV